MRIYEYQNAFSIAIANGLGQEGWRIIAVASQPGKVGLVYTLERPIDPVLEK